MRDEDLKGYLRMCNREKDPERIRWELVVRQVQMMFGDGTVPEEIAWASMALLPIRNGGYRVIGLVQVLLKVC